MENTNPAFDIVSYIADNGFKPGDKLPSIRTMASDMDCSPSEVRSGLITCAALGIVQTHARAGSFLSQVDNKRIESIFSLLVKCGVQYSNPVIMDIYQLKNILDVELFPLAAKYRTPGELVELQEILAAQEAAIGDIRRFIELDEAFHLKVASISRNNLVPVLVGILHAMLRESRIENPEGAHFHQLVLSEHRNLCDMIIAQDSENIAEVARKHTRRRIMELSAIAKSE